MMDMMMFWFSFIMFNAIHLINAANNDADDNHLVEIAAETKSSLWHPPPPPPASSHHDCQSKQDGKIILAVQTERQLKLQQINQPPKLPANSIPEIVIKSNDNELKLKFLSQSSSLHLEQLIKPPKYYHRQNPLDVQEIHEPTIQLKQLIKKPIHQNVHEIIIPTKTIVQEILPMKQIVKTIVSTANNHHQQKSPPSPSLHHGQEDDDQSNHHHEPQQQQHVIDERSLNLNLQSLSNQ